MQLGTIGAGVLFTLALPVSHGMAAYYEWTNIIEDDPFDGKGRMAMVYSNPDSIGVLVICDEGSNAITLRLATPMEAGSDGVTDRPIWIGAIVDRYESHLGFGNAMIMQNGKIGFDLELKDESAARLLEELKQGKDKIYVKIGEDTDPISFPLVGSTKAATKAIDYCLEPEDGAGD